MERARGQQKPVQVKVYRHPNDHGDTYQIQLLENGRPFNYNGASYTVQVKKPDGTTTSTTGLSDGNPLEGVILYTPDASAFPDPGNYYVLINVATQSYSRTWILAVEVLPNTPPA